MATEAYPTIETPSAAKNNLELLLTRQQQRIDILRSSLGLIGVVNTTRVIRDRIFNQGNHVIKVHPRNQLKFPITLTTVGSDLSIYREIIEQKVYQLPPNLVRKINGKSIVDLGAYIGISPANFATKHPDSCILAAEPYKRNYELLKTNVAPYGDQIEPVNRAFSTQEGGVGVAKQEIGLENHASNLFSSIHPSLKPEELVPSITPHMIMANLNGSGTIGLLKVDIEGAERETFADPAIDEMLRETELLLIETHDRYAPGSSQSVQRAAFRNGLNIENSMGHTIVYSRS